MPSLFSSASLLLATLFVGMGMPSASQASMLDTATTPSPQTDYAHPQHTPDTLEAKVGDLHNARAVAILHGVGLIHSRSAWLGNPGVLHLSLLANYSYSNHFPQSFDDKNRYSDTSRWVGTFAATWVFLPWLEAYGSYEASSAFSTYEGNTPISGQMLGNIHFGIKFAHRLAPGFYAGVDVGGRVFTSEQSMHSTYAPQALHKLRFGFRPTALLTWNAQELSARLPLVLHANAGVYVGRSNSFTLAEFTTDSNVWKTFAWNLNSRHHAFVSLGLEAPLPYATPFVEYQATLPLWTQEDKLRTPSFIKTNPQSLIVGAKLTMLPNFTITLGADIRLKNHLVPGLAPQPPWRIFFGISLATAPLPPLNAAPSLQPQPQPQPPAETPAAASPTTAPPAATPSAPIPLAPAQPQPQLFLSLKHGNKPVAGQVFIRAPKPQRFSVTPETPTASPLSLPTGPQWLEIIPQEGLAKIQKVNLTSKQQQTLLLDIESTPAAPLVRLVNQRILFAAPLAFAPNKAELTAHGQAQLRSLVDLLIRHHIQSLRLGSHVESQKTEASAMRLSAQRSQAVVDALAQLGIETTRVEVLNFGDTKPVAPNTVRKGRLLNRRMDFVVLEKWEPMP